MHFGRFGNFGRTIIVVSWTCVGRKPPRITKLSFLYRRVNLKDGMRAASTEDFTVLMDYLQFDNDMAFNFFVAETDMTTTLVLSEEQAMHLGCYSVLSRASR